MFQRTNGATTSQPGAAPWVSWAKSCPSPERAGQPAPIAHATEDPTFTHEPGLFRPDGAWFRVKRPCPRALPRAGLRVGLWPAMERRINSCFTAECVAIPADETIPSTPCRNRLPASSFMSCSARRTVRRFSASPAFGRGCAPTSRDRRNIIARCRFRMSFALCVESTASRWMNDTCGIESKPAKGSPEQQPLAPETKPHSPSTSHRPVSSTVTNRRTSSLAIENWSSNISRQPLSAPPGSVEWQR